MEDNKLQALNLPPIQPRLAERADGRPAIFDVIRRRYVALTPEEWVRQHFVHYLLEHEGYRRDLTPRLIVEYKAPEVEITQRVFDQITRYNMVLRADYLVVSNGLQHYCCRLDYHRHSYSFLRDIPAYGEL